MTDSGPQHQKLIDLLEILRTAGGFDFTYTLRPGIAQGASPETPAAQSASAQPATEAGAEGAGNTPSPARVSEPTAEPLEVVLEGPDVPLLLDRHGELLHAIESLAVAVLRLTPDQNEQLSFDAGNFKAERAAAISAQAEQAIAQVRSGGEPFVFPPMNARERRMLHMALAASGLATASSGEGARRFVVLYPEGHTPEPDRFAPPPPPRRNFGGRPGGNRPGNGRSGDRGSRGPGFGSRGSGFGSRGPGFDDRRGSRGPNRGPGGPPRLQSDQPDPSAVSDSLPGERRHRPALDPNGNPIENPALPDNRDAGNATPAPGSVEERLAKLRQNFRSR